MKKFFVLMTVMLVAVPVSMQADELSKALKKEYKAKMKDLKKGKWELYNSSRTLEVSLLSFYEELNSKENVREIVGEASRFSSKSVGHQTAINDACRTYAQQAGGSVKGRVTSDLASDGEDVASEFEHFYAAYERLVEKEIQGELQEKFSIIRKIDKDKNGNSIYEMQTFFLVDENAATQARIRAYQNALRETEAAQKYAEQISGFVQAGFE